MTKIAFVCVASLMLASVPVAAQEQSQIILLGPAVPTSSAPVAPSPILSNARAHWDATRSAIIQARQTTQTAREALRRAEAAEMAAQGAFDRANVTLLNLSPASTPVVLSPGVSAGPGIPADGLWPPPQGRVVGPGGAMLMPPAAAGQPLVVVPVPCPPQTLCAPSSSVTTSQGTTIIRTGP